MSLLHQNFGRQPTFLGLLDLKMKAACSFVWSCLPVKAAWRPRWLKSSWTPLWDSQISHLIRPYLLTRCRHVNRISQACLVWWSVEPCKVKSLCALWRHVEGVGVGCSSTHCKYKQYAVKHNSINIELCFTAHYLHIMSGTFRWDIPLLLCRIININYIQSNTSQLMILLRCISYIVSFNDMFRL